MKLIEYCFTLLIISGILAIATACNGGGDKNSRETQVAAGIIVTELDGKAAVIYQDSKNHFWFGSREKGVYQHDGKTLVLFTKNDGLCSYTILSVQEDDSGNLYFDTPDGVCKYDGEKFITLPVVESGNSQNDWRSEAGDLWFRMGWSHNGPFKYDGKNLHSLAFPKNEMADEFYKNHPDAPYNPYGLYSLFKDSKGNIWFGTANLGIYRFDGKELSWMYENQLTETPGGGAFGIRSIAEDSEGNYWICNANYKYTLLPNDTGNSTLKTMNYQRQTGIEDNKGLYFLSMLSDDNGDMWMLTYDQGVWRNDGKTLEQVFIEPKEMRILPTSMYKDRQGNLWFGTSKQGIYKYNGKTFEKFKIKS